MKSNINIYDFDGTIYDGDSSIDFFLFSAKKRPIIFLLIPKIIYYKIKYSLKLINKDKFKECFFEFIKYTNNVDKDLDEFWNKNIKKIKLFYLNQKQNNDIIISASPEFLIYPVSKKLHFKLIATNVDKTNGQFKSKNCYGEEKINRLKSIGIIACNEFYSDSMSDYPLKLIAKKAFLVKKNKITEWK